MDTKISKLLRQLRHNKKYSLEQVSELTCLSSNAISNIERGSDFKVSSLIKLLAIYNLDLCDISLTQQLKNFSKLSDPQKELVTKLIDSFTTK